MADIEFLRAHDAGCEMLGRGTGVPETLGKVADLIESAFGERVPDKIVAACGGLLLAWRATRNDPPAPRREGLASAARALLDAFGGNVPDWLASEAQALEAALPCIDGAALPAAPSVWIVQGEHFEVPGIKTSVHASHQAASAKAADLVNLMIDDTTVHKNSRPRRATPSDWAGVPLGWLQDYHGAAHCWVEIIETTLQGER